VVGPHPVPDYRVVAGGELEKDAASVIHVKSSVVDGVVRRARVEINPIGVVVVVATPRDDDLLALHPDSAVAGVAALDVLDHVGRPARDPDVA
jgi:hypothetical protein